MTRGGFLMFNSKNDLKNDGWKTIFDNMVAFQGRAGPKLRGCEWAMAVNNLFVLKFHECLVASSSLFC